MSELPSMEEFEKLARESDPTLFEAVPDATGVPHEDAQENAQVEEQPSAETSDESVGSRHS
jgi:hypothetical protein